MNELYPVAKLGNTVLIVNKDDVPYIGKARALEVKCIQVDLRYGTIDPPLELEKHLKFNPWKEVSEEERDNILSALAAKFSDEEILEKIMEPLIGKLVKPQQG